ncbi:chitin synthase-domain-containing protein [Lactifluus volemus]|nr:chitin synthase-domain-containing protein [Lactifluus volemus]
MLDNISWKKVVTCIVSAGRQKVNSRTLSVIAAMGAYQEMFTTNIASGCPYIRIYHSEYMYHTPFSAVALKLVSITPSIKIEGPEKGIIPVQIIFCLKVKNQKKINSHRWFFNAFGPILQPNVCPGPTLIYHLWKAFDINSNIGGYGEKFINPLVAAQNFEYRMSNIRGV